MELIEKINYYKEQNEQIEATKAELINAHLEQINKVIEDKIIALKDTLREDAINEVCGEEYKTLEAGIIKNNRIIEMLTEISKEDGFMEILEDIVPQKPLICTGNVENTLQDNVTNVETTVTGTNQDNLDGNLN